MAWLRQEVEMNQIWALCRLGWMKSGTDFFYVGAMGADSLMQGVAGDTELFGPVRDV